MDVDYSRGGGGVIPKYMKALLQVLNILAVITVSKLFVSQPLKSFFEKHLCRAIEILKKLINPESSDGLTVGSSCFL